MSHAVRFANYGGPDVLEIVDVDDRPPGPGQVRVAVVSAGVDPGEIGIREGALAAEPPVSFPQGQGSDFAGLVAGVGQGVTSVRVGDEVIGFSDCRNAQAEFATVAESRLIPKPHGLDWHTAGGLYIVGTTARACADAVGAEEGEAVVVTGASTAVGVLAAQLVMLDGARVLAIADAEHHDYLRGLGVVPIVAGPDLDDRIRSAAPTGVAGVIDADGGGGVDLAVRFGVSPRRICTVSDVDAAERTGAHIVGPDPVDPGPVLRELARLLACRQIELPVHSSFPLSRVREAYDCDARGHGLGKVVIDIRSIG